MTEETLKLLRWFIIGALTEQLDNRPQEFYVRDTMDITIGYLTGKRKLDGSCSDMQVYIAQEAAKLFYQ